MSINHSFHRGKVLLKALFQLDKRELFHFLFYQLGLRFGWYRWITQRILEKPVPADISLCPNFLVLPKPPYLSALYDQEKRDLIEEADEICQGQIRLFGGPPVLNRVGDPVTLLSWWDYETRLHIDPVEDIKFIWEPARFGWVFTLIRAFYLTGEKKYAEIFWQSARNFKKNNPVYFGPNWVSAQEVAIRMVALLAGYQIFGEHAGIDDSERKEWISYLVFHARRIPLTIDYARAQNNNHLVCEALGLFIAGCSFSPFPEGIGWRETGWKWLCQAVLNQIEEDGTYPQHSTNYHRLVLEAAILSESAAKRVELQFDEEVQKKLSAASFWLYEYVDISSGRVSNFGSNDGAHLLPLAPGGFFDFRPTLQAAFPAFVHRSVLPPGAWDELCDWFGLSDATSINTVHCDKKKVNPRIDQPTSWMSIRSHRFSSRPSHADILHVDLWWRGENLAIDPGTYRYSAPPPWNNSLAGTTCHNTIMVNKKDQMLRAGKFLWLDWPQTGWHCDDGAICAWHDGYHQEGIRHVRKIVAVGIDHWRVDDLLEQRGDRKPQPHIRIHWLLPDWQFESTQTGIKLFHPVSGYAELTFIPLDNSCEMDPICLIRAGELIQGNGQIDPVLGWISPTYSVKQPAISVITTIHGHPPIKLRSEWVLFNPPRSSL